MNRKNLINKNKKKIILGLNFQACEFGLSLEEEEKLEKNVTHFEPHDERGVTKIKVPGQRIERHTTLNKKYEKKKLDKQKQKEKNFRLEFSGL